MKKIIRSIVAMLTISSAVIAQNVNIPDANFKAYLVGNISINTNGDTEIQVSEAAGFTGNVNCQSLSISDLTGIEAFTNILYLYCNNNNLTSFNISNSLDLLSLRCNSNQLSSLDISNNSELTELLCQNNNLLSLNVTNLTELETFRGQTNQIETLDFSLASNLTSVNCGYNNLSYLNFGNGNNSNVTSFFAHSNPNLTCITVDDITYSTTNWTFIDPASSFSANCPPPLCTVNIPDVNFKAYLVGNTLININGDTEIQCSEATAFTGSINCTNQNISDLTGLESFINLDQLFCSSNGLSTIDVTSNTELTRLDFTNNNISTLDLSANQLIEKINGQSNLLQSLDLTVNIALEQLDIRDNSLTTLDLVNNTALVDLNCRNTTISTLNTASNINLAYIVCDQNNITSLDFSNNVNLMEVFCSENSLTSLNLANGNNSSVNFFEVTNNPNLTCITVDDVAYSTTNWTNIDATASFSTNCVNLISSITVQGQAGVSTITTQGGTLQMEATVLPASADDMTYMWSVVNGTGAASIGNNGLLTAVSDGTVEVTATANDASGESGTVTITISNQSLSVNESDVLSLVSIYPNPVQDQLFVEVGNLDITEMSILDISGKVIKSIDVNALNVDVSDLNQGVYFLKISSNTGVSTKRFIKQ